ENEVLEVIPEEHVQDENHPELLVGYTDNYLKVQFEGTPDMIGKIVRVKITKAGYPHNEGTFVRSMDNASHAQSTVSQCTSLYWVYFLTCSTSVKRSNPPLFIFIPRSQAVRSPLNTVLLYVTTY